MNAMLRLALLTLGLMGFLNPVAGQNVATGANAGRAETQRQLTSMNAKLNQLVQSQGGRYVFLVSQGELIRLDTQTGQIAFYNIVAGASWDTLEIPEKTVKPGNAFYEQYVQVLDKIDFNTN